MVKKIVTEEQELELRAAAEEYRKLLLRGPVPLRVVNHWVQRMAEDDPILETQVGSHFRSQCTPDTMGQWAVALFADSAWSPPQSLLRILKKTARRANDRQMLTAALQILGLSEAELGLRVDECDALTPEIYDQLISQSMPKSMSWPEFREAERVVEAVRALGIHELMQWVTGRYKYIARFQTPPADVVAAGSAHEDANPATDIRNESTETADRSAVARRPRLVTEPTNAATILARPDSSSEITRYLERSNQFVLEADTSYLAGELTWHDQWILLFEQPVRIQLDSTRVRVASVSVISYESVLAVQIADVDLARPRMRCTLSRQGTTWYSPGSVEHFAVCVLSLLFGEVDSLRPTRQDDDWDLSEQLMPAGSDTPSAIYVYRGDYSWGDFDGILRPSASRDSAGATSRMAHDVRGHFRIVNGKKYKVKPHRRRS